MVDWVECVEQACARKGERAVSTFARDDRLRRNRNATHTRTKTFVYDTRKPSSDIAFFPILHACIVPTRWLSSCPLGWYGMLFVVVVLSLSSVLRPRAQSTGTFSLSGATSSCSFSHSVSLAHMTHHEQCIFSHTIAAIQRIIWARERLSSGLEKDNAGWCWAEIQVMLC